MRLSDSSTLSSSLILSYILRLIRRYRVSSQFELLYRLEQQCLPSLFLNILSFFEASSQSLHGRLAIILVFVFGCSDSKTHSPFPLRPFVLFPTLP